MKRSIGILLALALLTGAGLVQARGSGGHGGGGHASGGHASGGHASGGHAGGSAGGRPGMSGGGQHFSTGSVHFSGVHVGGRPPIGIRPAPPIAVRPGYPPRHRVIVGGAVVVAAPFYWYPPYPYYYPYPYGYVSPAYGGSDYPTPTYIEQGDVRYYCPDSQDYYPNVPTCPSPWMQVIPGTGEAVTN